jgi:hypothetical protein
MNFVFSKNGRVMKKSLLSLSLAFVLAATAFAASKHKKQNAEKPSADLETISVHKFPHSQNATFNAYTSSGVFVGSLYVDCAHNSTLLVGPVLHTSQGLQQDTETLHDASMICKPGERADDALALGLMAIRLPKLRGAGDILKPPFQIGLAQDNEGFREWGDGSPEPPQRGNEQMDDLDNNASSDSATLRTMGTHRQNSASPKTL